MEEYSVSSHVARQRYHPACVGLSSAQRNVAAPAASAPVLSGGGELDKEINLERAVTL